MKKYPQTRLLLSIAALFLASLISVSSWAATNKRLTQSNGRTYTLTVLGEYGHNRTWGHHGGGEIRAFLPFNPNVDVYANVGALSSNVYAVSATVRPKFALPVGEMFVDATFAYSAYQRNETHDFVGALSLGYRMDYLSAQIGCNTHTIAAYGRIGRPGEEFITDPFNFVYRLSVNVRPLCERWNIFFGVSNFTELEYERHWQPLFFLSGYYDFPPANNFEYSYNAASHFRLLAEIYLKPTGMFHLDASYYGCRAKFGFAYKF